MGIDALDIAFRLEERYGISLGPLDWESVAENRTPFDITAGELHFLVGVKLREIGFPVPSSHWHGVQVSVAESLGKPIRQIKPETWLVRDLGMT